MSDSSSSSNVEVVDEEPSSNTNVGPLNSKLPDTFQLLGLEDFRATRYQIQGEIGRGGFGVVYLAHDEQLQRPVAIKIPHMRGKCQQWRAEAYLNEARIVAQLEHPGIVSVFDVGSTEQTPCFIVSRFVDGESLSVVKKRRRLSISESVSIVIAVSDALHFAHTHGIVHRDIKPGNILLDNALTPYLVDFGLALREDDPDDLATMAGTVAYMSPEQARGEGHRIDVRSDVYSIGVVLFELLAGRKPYRATSPEEMLREVENDEGQSLRELNEEVPRELERICSRAMAKLANDRYSSALELADDLRAWLTIFDRRFGRLRSKESMPEILSDGAWEPASVEVSRTSERASRSERSGSSRSESSALHQVSEQRSSLAIVPKGLRSFDADDASFFLDLLPGARDRNRLPLSVSSWKQNIESTDSSTSFSVGVIYGPSGCGKSSFLKAGLLPLLAPTVVPIYVDCQLGDIEYRISAALASLTGHDPAAGSLAAQLSAFRRGGAELGGPCVLIVLDQFEQWLHLQTSSADRELVSALRQCDGVRLKCLIGVRDDFWMAVTGFLADLEVELVQGRNIAALDLFPVRHATKVLTAYGQAFGELPPTSELSVQQKEFLTRAIEGLTVNGKVICVHLALFAEMMQGRTWEVATLNKVGGVAGLGITFLEETFCSSAADPRHRLHERAVRAVLRELLPAAGTDIRSHSRPRSRLLSESGYADRPQDFQDLIHLLDQELRLITPTDSSAVQRLEVSAGADGRTAEEIVALDSRVRGNDGAVRGNDRGVCGNDRGVCGNDGSAGEQHFQITHDYLIRPLREWLHRKQKETQRGRAELLLAERSALWSHDQATTFLPSLTETATIVALTDRSRWTDSECHMMRLAMRRQELRMVLLAATFVIALLIGWQVRIGVNRNYAAGLVNGLANAETSRLGELLPQLREYQTNVEPMLIETYDTAAEGSREKLHAAVALLEQHPEMLNHIESTALQESLQTAQVLAPHLAPYATRVIPSLVTTALDVTELETVRFRALCLLAALDSGTAAWNSESCAVVAEHVVTASPSELRACRELLRNAPVTIQELLLTIAVEDERTDAIRRNAYEFLCDCWDHEPDRLIPLIGSTTESLLPVLLESLQRHADVVIPLCRELVAEPLGLELSATDEPQLASTKANHLLVLIRLGAVDVAMDALIQDRNAQLHAYVAARMSSYGVDLDWLLTELERTSHEGVLTTLIFATSSYPETVISGRQRTLIERELSKQHRQNLDAGVHAASGWLIRKWKLVMPAISAEQNQDGAAAASSERATWLIDPVAGTMSVIHATEFQMGSPDNEPNRGSNELRHSVQINRTLAMKSHEVTVNEYRQFLVEHPEQDYVDEELRLNPTDGPQCGITWYSAAAYCNWLSRKAGLPESEWCYVPTSDGLYQQAMGCAENHLQRPGFRLPTEAEWEYACRAGTMGPFSCGSDDEILTEYAWCLNNVDTPGVLHEATSIRTASLKKPNAFGLFDMTGSAQEWCEDKYLPYNEIVRDSIPEGGSEIVLDEDLRCFRGGSVGERSRYCRSAARANLAASKPDANTSFRVVRTIVVDRQE